MHQRQVTRRRAPAAGRTAALGASIIAAAFAGPGCDDDAKQEATTTTALEQALRGVGGRQALGRLSTLSFHASGTSSVIDEGFEPAGPSVAASDFEADVSIDADHDTMRLSQQRTSVLLFPGVVTTFSEIVNAEAGFVAGSDFVFAPSQGAGAPMSPSRWASVRKQQRLLNPHLLLRSLAEAEVADGGAADVDGRPGRKLVVTDPGGAHDVTLFVDGASGRIASLSTVESDPLRGDVALKVVYDRWEPAGDLAFPMRVAVELDGQTVHVEERTAVAVNPAFAAEHFVLPGGAVPPSAGPLADYGAMNSQHLRRYFALGTATFFDAPQGFPTVVGNEIGQGSGVYHLTGAGHHSLLVDQGDRVVLVEAPLEAARSEAVLAWIDGNLAGGLAANPVSHVIATHHHSDHAGGLRTFAARGATVVVGDPSEAFLAGTFSAARTLDPDAPPAAAGPPRFVTVKRGEPFTIGNVTAHHVAARHSADMLIVHVAGAGAAGAVFNSDLYLPDLAGIAPGSVFVAGSEDLRTALGALGLADEGLLMLGGHGNVDFATGRHFVVTYAEFNRQLDAVLNAAPR